jgi:CRP-like cAMP-binding protein
VALPALQNNELLSLLSHRDSGRIARVLEQVQVRRGELLLTPYEAPRFVFFPCGCVASVSIRRADGSETHVGLIGREGFIGLPIALGAYTGMHVVSCQVSGDAFRMPLAQLDSALRQIADFRQLLFQYAGVRLLEETQHLACCALHQVQPRLARWLLLLRDRGGTNNLHVTQEFLAAMLSVRRPYLTNCMQDLQREGTVRYERGRIHIVDTAALENIACEDYGALRTVYEQQFRLRSRSKRSSGRA